MISTFARGRSRRLSTVVREEAGLWSPLDSCLFKVAPLQLFLRTLGRLPFHSSNTAGICSSVLHKRAKPRMLAVSPPPGRGGGCRRTAAGPGNRGIFRRGTDILPAGSEAIAQAPADLPSWRAGLIRLEFRTDMHVVPGAGHPIAAHFRRRPAPSAPGIAHPALTTDPPQNDAGSCGANFRRTRRRQSPVMLRPTDAGGCREIDRSQDSGRLCRVADPRGRLCNASRVRSYVTYNPVGNTFWACESDMHDS